jgi:hypothetical protein
MSFLNCCSLLRQIIKKKQYEKITFERRKPFDSACRCILATLERRSRPSGPNFQFELADAAAALLSFQLNQNLVTVIELTKRANLLCSTLQDRASSQESALGACIALSASVPSASLL